MQPMEKIVLALIIALLFVAGLLVWHMKNKQEALTYSTQPDAIVDMDKLRSLTIKHNKIRVIQDTTGTLILEGVR